MRSRLKREQDVYRKVELLVALIKGQLALADFPCFLMAIESQSTLAQYSQLGFAGMSLNTFKAISNIIIDGGFHKVDLLRRKLLVIQNKASTKKVQSKDTSKTVRGLTARLKEKRDIIRRMEGELLVSTQCIQNTFRMYESFVRDKGSQADLQSFWLYKNEMLALFAHGVEHDEAFAKLDLLRGENEC